MNDLLSRGPTGRFIMPSKALRAWLPELLDRSGGNELDELLTGASQWCLERAAQHYENAAQWLRAEPPVSDDDKRQRRAIRRTVNAANWLRKDKILAEARKQLHEVSRG